MMTLAYLLSALSILILIIASIGMIRLSDALSRQHAATKAATLSISLLILGLLCFALASDWETGWVIRLVLLLAILMITLPIASHALAKSAYAETVEKIDDV